MKEGINLTRLWSEANGIRVESLSGQSEIFIFLRIQSKDMPASYLTPDPWFLSCDRIGKDDWQVGLRGSYMRNIKGEHEAAAQDIFKNVHALAKTRPGKMAEWTSPVVGPLAGDESAVRPHQITVSEQSHTFKN